MAWICCRVGAWARRGFVPDVRENYAGVPRRGRGRASPWGLPGVGTVTRRHLALGRQAQVQVPTAALHPQSEGPGGINLPRLGHQPGTPPPPLHRVQAGSAGVSPLSPGGPQMSSKLPPSELTAFTLEPCRCSASGCLGKRAPRAGHWSSRPLCVERQGAYQMACARGCVLSCPTQEQGATW